METLIDPRLDTGRRGDGGTLPSTCVDLPLRELMSDSGYVMYEQHGVMGSAPSSWWFQADVHRLAVVDPGACQARRTEGDITVDSVVSSPARAVVNPTAPRSRFGVYTTPLPFTEIIDIISQVDIVRCLVDAYDRGYPPDHHALRAAMEEPASLHMSIPFGTFPDAPAGAVLAVGVWANVRFTRPIDSTRRVCPHAARA